MRVWSTGSKAALGVLLAVSGPGCGPDAPPAEEGAATGEATSTSTGDGDGDPGDGDGDIGDGDGDPGDGDGDPGDGDGDEPLECAEPEPVEIEAQFVVDPPEPIQAACSLIGENMSNQVDYEMVLDCEGVEVTISLLSTIAYKPSPGGMMNLDYRVDGDQRWLALRQDFDMGALILGAVAAETLDPPGTTLPALFGDPSLLIADEQPCPPVPDGCGAQRLALSIEVELIGDVGHVFDHESWLASFLAFGYAIEVEYAVALTQPDACPEESPGRFELLVTWFSGP